MQEAANPHQKSYQDWVNSRELKSLRDSLTDKMGDIATSSVDSIAQQGDNLTVTETYSMGEEDYSKLHGQVLKIQLWGKSWREIVV